MVSKSETIANYNTNFDMLRSFLVGTRRKLWLSPRILGLGLENSKASTERDPNAGYPLRLRLKSPTLQS